MRTAIVSDVHGNLTGFDAVLADLRHRAPDLVLHGGDLALMGAQPAEVIDRVRELGYGHIHRPYTRTLTPRLTVANSGSVGMPWDGDPRASYLLIEDTRPHLVRVEYDIEQEAALLLGSGYPDAPCLVEMRRRGAFLRPGVTSA